VNLRPSLKSSAASKRFSFRIVLFLAPSIITSILTSFHVPAEEKHPHRMMLPPPSFTVVGGGLNTNPDFRIIYFPLHFIFMSNFVLDLHIKSSTLNFFGYGKVQMLFSASYCTHCSMDYITAMDI
ncbi:hypothetical protein CHARACLAT_009963, partial [Characodon lateralis]|nr:hypothetical protein [Characodon lateralis]